MTSSFCCFMLAKRCVLCSYTCASWALVLHLAWIAVFSKWVPFFAGAVPATTASKEDDESASARLKETERLMAELQVHKQMDNELCVQEYFSSVSHCAVSLLALPITKVVSHAFFCGGFCELVCALWMLSR